MEETYSKYSCSCTSNIIINKKRVDFFKEYNLRGLSGRELKRIFIECNFKFVKLLDKYKNDNNMTYNIGYNRNGTGMYFYDISDICKYATKHTKYICEVELLDDSIISIYNYKFETNKFILKNETELDKKSIGDIACSNKIHDGMYIKNSMIDSHICIKQELSYLRSNITTTLYSNVYMIEQLKNKHLKFIAFDKLYSTSFFEFDKPISFIEISSIAYILTNKIKNPIDKDDYIYDVEITDESTIINFNSYIFAGTNIKLTNKRKLIDDLQLLSYFHYDIFTTSFSVDEILTKNILYSSRNILDYFTDDTLNNRMCKLVDLFFNCRLYLLEFKNMNENLEKFILSLFNTKNEDNEDNKGEIIKQCIYFIKLLLNIIINKIHILLKTFDYESLKNICEKIIECLIKNKCVDSKVIESLNRII